METQKKTPVRAVLAVVSFVLAAVMLVLAGFGVGRVADSAKALQRYEADLEQARRVEDKIRRLFGDVADLADEIAQKIQKLDFSDTQAWLQLPKQFEDMEEQMKDAVAQLSDICGEDYTFLLDSLPLERYKEQLKKLIRQRVKNETLDKLIGEDNLLRDFADKLLGEDGGEWEDFNLADEIRRLMDYDFIGALEQKAEEARSALIRGIIFLTAEMLAAVGFAVTGVIVLRRTANAKKNIG